ncbi:hypothetical protein RV11_GL003517 [Enterococcus phoeniculicola]|nr:CD1375 family protein [Enterococcus phoeniculicola]OJG71796.1 hypothetical protein RV11_GL003517 [Enterococcus phoeniculicola]
MQQQLTKVAILLLRKDVKTMAVIYATLIIKGKKVIGDVPSTVKDQVVEILVEMDLPELAK